MDSHEGEDLGQIAGVRISAEDADAAPADADEGSAAVLFVPEGTDPADALNVRVVRVKRPDFDDLVARRC